MFALTLDLGPRMTPDYFGARLLDPLDKATLQTAKDAKKALASNAKNQTATKTTCATARADGDYETLLENFEASFTGILPGAGNLLLEHPSMVNNRREKLIFEVMKKYANLKFCIPEDQFKLVYLADYKNVIAQLNSLFQVVLYEKDQKKTGEDKENLSFDQNNPVFIDTAAGEYMLVEKDLVSTHKYVTEVIDRAIASAVELDRWTEQRLNNLGAKTNNKLTLGSNELIKINNDISNSNVEVNSANSFILENINKDIASIQPFQVKLGGAGVPMVRTTGTSKMGSTYPSEVYSPKADIDTSAAIKQLSFGLLNLVDKNIKAIFLSQRAGKDLLLYVAALNHIDPFVPGVLLDPGAMTAISSHNCWSIDLTGSAASSCFNGAPTLAESTAKANPLSKNEATGMAISTPTTTTTQAGPDGKDIVTQSSSDNVGNVNIVEVNGVTHSKNNPVWVEYINVSPP
jgi:hypothetical protein